MNKQSDSWLNTGSERSVLAQLRLGILPRNNWVNLILKSKPDFHYLETNDQLKCIFNDCGDNSDEGNKDKSHFDADQFFKLLEIA